MGYPVYPQWLHAWAWEDNMRIRLPATAYRGRIGAKEEKTIWEMLFQQLNSWTMQTCLFWVAE